MHNKGLKRALSASVMVCVAAITFTACGVDAGSDEDKANIAELERRGFTEPVLADGGSAGGLPSYDVGIGSCRVKLDKGNDYWGWTYDDTLRDVDAVKLQDSGLLPVSCFEGAP